MQVVLPGDAVSLPSSSSVTLGPGVVQLPTDKDGHATQLVATQAGILGNQQLPASHTKGNAQATMTWVESARMRYTPSHGEAVIGVIIARHAEGYRVDIGSSQAAALDALAFEDATKRNKPNLKVGTVVYARVSLALPFCDPEIECFDASTGKSAGFGELAGGMLLRNQELRKCRALFDGNNPLRAKLGKRFHFPFELAVGLNGCVWIKAAEPKDTIDIMNLIKNA